MLVRTRALPALARPCSRLLAPLSYAEDETLDAPWRLDRDILTLRCAPGVFRARVAPVT